MHHVRLNRPSPSRVIVVGYHTLTIYPGLNMFTVNLGNMANPEGYSLDELFPGLDKDGNPTPGLVPNSSSSTADYVKVWDPEADGGTGGYVATYYLFKTSRASALNYKWVLNKDTAAPAGFIKMGQGVWYYCAGTGFTMTLPYPYDL